MVLAHEAGVEPVIVLTKSDLRSGPQPMFSVICRQDPRLLVAAVNALEQRSAQGLYPWCRSGQTVAVMGLQKSKLLLLKSPEVAVVAGTEYSNFWLKYVHKTKSLENVPLNFGTVT